MSKLLMIGTGPVAIQLANICYLKSDYEIDMVGRASTSEKSKRLYQAYKKEKQFEVKIQNEAHQHLEGKFEINRLYKDVKNVKGEYETVVMACTADAYYDTLQQLSLETLQSVKHVILISPTFGSQMIVEQFMSKFSQDIEVISFSTYLGDTRIVDKEAPNHVLTTGVKKKLYMGSTHSNSTMCQRISALAEQLKIQLEVVESPLHAETRNSSLYVHPPLFMNDFSLKAIFEGTDVPVYVYKLFPEGPITMTLIREMRLMWKEMMAILQAFRVPSVNLLQFMVKENYPVRPETLDEGDIEHFEILPDILQEYLLYVRYTAILIDPFSQPDENGHYFDFSAVPFKQVYKNEQDVVQIPRMPSEDYYRTAVIQHIGKMLGIKTPMIDQFLTRYEASCQAYKAMHQDQQLSSQFNTNLFEGDKALVTKFLEINRTLS
ncbi:TPA: staphylopine dehydrogenase CntM [Staphylococcus aureus]|nr:staphylopine dehydrogenase CntM [Staphylococcus aureus]